MNTCNSSSSAGIQPESPFYKLPLLAYDGIFSHLDRSSIRVCRLVCSEWYIIILKLYSSPNCFCVQTVKYAWNTTKCLEENIKKSLEMKVYEDDICPVENLKLENVKIGDCEKLIEKSADFRETIDNITALNLTNAYFGDCPTLLKFLGRFKKLRKLVLIHGTFSSLIEMSFFHLRWYLATDAFGATELPKTLRSLHIEIRQDNSSAPLLLEILNAKIKDLKEFQLKIIPSSDGLFKKALMTTTFHFVISSLQRSTFFLCWFLANVLRKNEQSLKSLSIHWKMNGTNFILHPNQVNADIATTGAFRVFWNAFTPLLLPANKLRLTELSLELGNVSTRCQQFNEIILPFVAIQIQRELRQITLNNFQSPLLFPEEMYSQIFPNFQGEEFLKFLKAMKMSLSMELLMVGTKEFAQRIQTFLADKYSWLYIRELRIKIIAALNSITTFTEIAELLPDYIVIDYILGDEGGGGDNDNRNLHILFCRLETLIIHQDLKHLKNFNICRICYQCPALKVLEIVDGPFYAYRNKKLDKRKISLAVIQDFDIRLIFSHLKNLRSLTIWANMESITDFSITGYPQPQQISPDEVNILTRFKENIPEILRREIKMEDNHTKFNSTIQTLLEFPVADSKKLQKLSLRGVGIGITDGIVSSFVSDDNKRLVVGLERLEIIGRHKISKIGSQKLKGAIKEVNL